jgi:Mg-chelatase subunit ChlD
MTYFRDWFGRREDYGYTGYNPSKRYISWDDGYDDYSDFFFGKKSKSTSTKINVDHTAQLLLTMAKVLGVNGKRFARINVGERIALPTDLLSDPNVSMDAFIGASLQSISHSIHTSQEERKKIDRAKGRVSIPNFVFNALNAERINNLMSDDTPGYLKFVQKYKEFKYKQRVGLSTGTSQQRFLDLFDRIIRYPDKIEESELEEFAEPIDKIKAILGKAGGIPADMEDCLKVSKKIGKVIQEFFEKDNPSSKEEGDDEGDGGEDDEKSKPSGTDSSDSSSESESKSKSKFELSKEAADAINRLMRSSDMDKAEDKELFDRFMNTYHEYEEGSSSTSTKASFHPPVERHSKEEYAAMYKKYLERINLTKASVIGTLLKRKSRDYRFSIKSARSGRLDTNKLAEAKQRVQTIYERFGTVKTDKLAIVILVDESGSMAGMEIDKAKEAAIFLYESLKDVKDVELFIYGHTADESRYGGAGTTQIYKYHEPGFNSPINLAKISAKCENRDGTAILATAKRVRQFTNNNAVFIVISDGEPSASGYRGDLAVTDVRRRVNEVEKMGFQVIQIAISGYRSRDMFKHVINMDDISTFPVDFVSFLKKKINSLIKEKITL